MDDTEAKFLIDQFNKYVSWKTRHGELELVASAVAIATTGLGLSVAAFFWRLVDIVMTALTGAMLLAVLALLVLVWRLSSRIDKTYKDYEKRLTALEDYRSNYKSLPDAITFGRIINPKEFKTKDLEKLLKESVPIPGAQT